jgi:hypothetical protein
MFLSSTAGYCFDSTLTQNEVNTMLKCVFKDSLFQNRYKVTNIDSTKYFVNQEKDSIDIIHVGLIDGIKRIVNHLYPDSSYRFKRLLGDKIGRYNNNIDIVGEKIYFKVEYSNLYKEDESNLIINISVPNIPKFATDRNIYIIQIRNPLYDKKNRFFAEWYKCCIEWNKANMICTYIYSFISSYSINYINPNSE